MDRCINRCVDVNRWIDRRIEGQIDVDINKQKEI